MFPVKQSVQSRAQAPGRPLRLSHPADDGKRLGQRVDLARLVGMAAQGSAVVIVAPEEPFAVPGGVGRPGTGGQRRLIAL